MHVHNASCTLQKHLHNRTAYRNSPPKPKVMRQAYTVTTHTGKGKQSHIHILCKHTQTRIHTRECALTHARTYTHKHAHTYIHTHTHTNIHMHTHILTHKHTHIHTKNTHPHTIKIIITSTTNIKNVTEKIPVTSKEVSLQRSFEKLNRITFLDASCQGNPEGGSIIPEGLLL